MLEHCAMGWAGRHERYGCHRHSPGRAGSYSHLRQSISIRRPVVGLRGGCAADTGSAPFLVWVPVILALSGQVQASLAWDSGARFCVAFMQAISYVHMLIGKDTEMPDMVAMLPPPFGGIALFGATGILLGPIGGPVCDGLRSWRGNAFEEESRERQSTLNPEQTREM